MGCIASALFVSVGLLYERYKTRIINYYGGVGIYNACICCFVFFVYSLVIYRFQVQERL
jgi:NADH:ubiquinone oxidoreductase subunit 4 (subunit M)